MIFPLYNAPPACAAAMTAAICSGDNGVLAILERPDIDHHVDFRRAVFDGCLCFADFVVSRRRTSGKPTTGTL